jgi:hypothetical protein
MSLSTATPRLQSMVGQVGLNGRGLALVAGFLALLMRPALFDPDYYWHIEAGRLIAAQWALPSVDPFSYTAAGQAWVAHEWLFEVLLYGVLAAAGSFGVKLMSAVLGTASVLLVYAAANRVLARPTVAAWLAGAFYLFVYEFPSPRPQLLTYAFLAAYLYILVSFKYGRDVRLLPALPVLMIPWVNAHGGYVIGILLVAAFCISEWLVLRATNTDEDGRRRLRRLAAMAVLIVLASLLNPYFAGHWVYPFEVMGLQATQYIPEWRGPDFGTSYGRLFLLSVVSFCALQIYRARKPDITELGVPGLFIVAGFTSNRHTLLAAMAMIIFAAAAIRDGLRSRRPSRRRWSAAKEMARPRRAQQAAWSAEGPSTSPSPSRSWWRLPPTIRRPSRARPPLSGSGCRSMRPNSSSTAASPVECSTPISTAGISSTSSIRASASSSMGGPTCMATACSRSIGRSRAASRAGRRYSTSMRSTTSCANTNRRSASS